MFAVFLSCFGIIYQGIFVSFLLLLQRFDVSSAPGQFSFFPLSAKESSDRFTFPAEIADEIFMPFFTTRKKGTGVGLSYSRQVMNMNGGRIEFSSIPGHTVFRVLF
jgi:hypothetical protein